MPIRSKRVYAPAEATDGRRYLIDRLWPRGIRKDRLALTAWLQDLAPSAGLRVWFGHEPGRYQEFRQRYREELGRRKDLLRQIAQEAVEGTVTLLYSARDEEHCNATVLREILERMAQGPRVGHRRRTPPSSNTDSTGRGPSSNRVARRMKPTQPVEMD